MTVLGMPFVQGGHHHLSTTEGELWSWGLNSHGQLGQNNQHATTIYNSPRQVGALTTWSAAGLGKGGWYMGVAIQSDGSMWSWGRGINGQLAHSNVLGYSSPKQVGALTTWASTDGYIAHHAVKTDGTLWAWGKNNTGQLGLGDVVYRSSPVQVGSLTTWASSSDTHFASAAIKTDGTLWVMGRGTYGTNGLGNTTGYSSPKQVGSLTNWSTISVGNSSMLAIKTDGTMWTWGYGQSGRLGLGNTTSYSSPKQIGSLTSWSSASVSVNAATVTAVRTDGKAFSWGHDGAEGRLGHNVINTDESSPKQIGSLTDWSEINTRNIAAIALKTDRTAWCWSQNQHGHLGLGDNTSRSSPTQLGALTTWLKFKVGSSSGMGIKQP